MSTAVRRLLAVFVTFTVVSVCSITSASASAPGAPTGLTPVPGDKQVALSWTAPGVTGGGGGISNYNVEYSTNAGATWYSVIRPVSTTASYTVTGLTNGTTYALRVSAVNGVDVGAYSTVVSAIPFVVHTANDLPLFSACPTGLIPSAGLSDTTSTDVDCIAYYGITKGTTATTYSPDDQVTRWQMALFLTRMAGPAAITLGSGVDQGFTDISGKSAEIRTAINQIKQLGITVGKTATTYAPDDNVTREEMAMFISRLLKKATVGPGGNTEYLLGSSGAKEIKSNDADHNFTDLSTTGLMEARNSIVNLWNLGATDAQAFSTYEPLNPMTRKSMATFMASALAHTNARPAGLVLQASGYRVVNGTAVTFSATHRTAGFAPISNSYVDTFRFIYSSVATVVRFDTGGQCTTSIIQTTVSNALCTLDPSDPRTDTSGNLATFLEVPPNINKLDVWAWTTTPSVVYDNDLHGATASKVTVETSAS